MEEGFTLVGLFAFAVAFGGFLGFVIFRASLIGGVAGAGIMVGLAVLYLVAFDTSHVASETPA